MGGSSSGQVTGYKYLTNFLLFIGNPIEKLIAVNFDKRGWMTGRRVGVGDSGELCYIHAPNLYGENEGGVSGTLCIKHGTNTQLSDAAYKNYMESIGSRASAYPYQSYISFSGGELLESLEHLTEDQLQELADQYNDGIVPGNGFYVGNSGYMKEMLLWPKRIHVRNDGRAQWYDEKSEIGKFYISEMAQGGSSSGDPINTIFHRNFFWQGPFAKESIEERNIFIQNPLEAEPQNLGEVSAGFSGIQLNQETSINAYIDVNFKGLIKLLAKIEYTESGGFEPILNNVEVIKYQVKPTSSSDERIDHAFEVIMIVAVKGLPAKVGFNVKSTNPKLTTGNTYYNLANVDLTISFPRYASGAGYGDINPIHKIREILTDDTAMNKPVTSVNDVNFRKAADRIYDEGLGISWSITEKSCIDAINELCYHIEAGIRVNRQTGLYEMVLFRDDWFAEDAIHTITENKIKSMQYEITNADEVINQVNVNFYDRENIKNSSFSISENGLIQTLNRVNAETVDFPYFMNMRNAEIVANWKLKQLSTGAFKGAFTTGWREARKWNRYDLIRLPWSKRWTWTILVRIMSINLGGPTNNEVSIEFIEVVPATGMMNTTIVADDQINNQPLPPQSCNAKVFELPYFEAVQKLGEREANAELSDTPEAGYLCAIAEKPQNNSLSAALHVDSGSGFERVATVNYCETAYLDQAIDRLSSIFIVKKMGNIASVRTGSQIFINDEIMVYQSYDAETKSLTVKRSALDSALQNHTSNSILYFADDFVAIDQTLYVDGEAVEAKVLTTTPSGVLALSDALTHEVEFNARAIRPYPPANVKINGKYWPEEIETDLVLTWVDRNRLQQTGGEIIGWFDDGVTIEPNTQTHLILTQLNKDGLTLATSNVNLTGATSYLMPISSMQANTHSVKITLKTLRDGYESLNPFIHTVELSQFFSAPYDLTVEFKND